MFSHFILGKKKCGLRKMAAEFVALRLAVTVVSQAVQTISHLLQHEAASLRGVRGRVESLQMELTRIQCFLEDADQKQQHDKRMQNWVAEV